MNNPQTFKVDASFYITSNQFKTPEDLKVFIESMLKDYEGTEYKTLLSEPVKVEFKY